MAKNQKSVTIFRGKKSLHNSIQLTLSMSRYFIYQTKTLSSYYKYV